MGSAMPKIIIFPEKTEIVDGKERVILKQRKNYSEEDKGKYDTTYGQVDLSKKEGVVNGKKYYVMPASFSDEWKRLRRGAQIITQKDIGAIISQTGIGKESIVGEAGTGSGALACALANVCKKVYSYDVDEKAIDLGKQNACTLKLDNIKFTLQDVKTKHPEKNVDVFILDMKNSWEALKMTVPYVRIGGYIVSYNSSMPAVSEFVNTCRKRDDVLLVKTIEVMQREWNIKDFTARPRDVVQHTGFLTFARRIK